MTDQAVTALVTVGIPEADEEELTRVAMQLRRQLLKLDVESVERVSIGDAPPHTRSAELFMAGGLLLSLAKTPEVVKSVAAVLQALVGSHPATTVTISVAGDSMTITGKDLSPAQQRAVETFFAHHSA